MKAAAAALDLSMSNHLRIRELVLTKQLQNNHENLCCKMIGMKAIAAGNIHYDDKRMLRKLSIPIRKI